MDSLSPAVGRGGRRRRARPAAPWLAGAAAARLPGAHLHMISWVSSTRHISGFLSWPSYTMACVWDKQRAGSRSAYRFGATPPRAPQASLGGRCPAPREEATGTPGHPPSHSATSVAGMLHTARLPSSSHGHTPGLSSRGLRGVQGRACGDPGTAGEGAQPPQAAPGAWATATWRRPLAIVLYEVRSLCQKKSIRVRCDYRRREDAGRRGSPPCTTRRCPGRAPQAPALRPACRTHTTPRPPGARAEAGVSGCVVRRLPAAGSGARRPHVLAPRQGAGGLREGPGPGGAPVRLATCFSPDDIWKEKC